MDVKNLVGEAVVRVSVDDSGVSAEFDKIGDKAKREGEAIGNSFSSGFANVKAGVDKAFLPAVGVLAGVGAAAFDAAQAAGDLAETQSKVNVIFGASAKELESWANAAPTALGQTEQAALDAAATMATFGKAAGLSGGDLVDFSTGLTDLSSDLASFYNTDPSEAAAAIGAALRGETEPIRKYGVMLDDAALKAEAMALGIYSGTGALTQQQKTLAAQAAIFKQTTDAQGDFARTSDGAANQQRILAATVEQLKTDLGESLLPVMQSVVGMLSSFATWASENQGIVKVLAVVVGGLAAAIVALKVAMTVATVAQWAMNSALLANPITWIVLAVAALVAGLVLFFTKTELGRAILEGFFSMLSSGMEAVTGLFSWFGEVIADVFRWIGDNWPTLLAILTGPIGLAVKWIIDNWETVTSVFSDTVETIKSAFGNVIEIVVSPFRTAINTVLGLVNALINAWNSLEFSIPPVTTPWGQDFGGVTFGVPDIPNIPQLADGGIVKARPGGTLALLGEAGRDEAVVPLGKGGMGSPVQITVNMHPGSTGDPAELKAAVKAGIDETLRRGQMRLIAAGGSY